MKKKPKYKIIKFSLPKRVVRFYERVAKLAGITRNQAILTVVALKIEGDKL